VSAGIAVNIQLVLCPGLNDGDELVFTLDELQKLSAECRLQNADNAAPDPIGDAIQSIAAVPVGLTAHREGLYPLEPFNRESARAVIKTIYEFQTRFRETGGSRRVYASDEFFLIAGMPIPEADYYEDYPQYENGVGMLRSFMDEMHEAIEDAKTEVEAETETGDTYSVIVTGESAFDAVRDLCAEAMEAFPHIHAEVIAVKNRFFGGHVTVTGLLTGSDIITALRGRDLKGTLLLCEDMFKKDTELFLDDLTLSDVEKALNIKAQKFARDGYELFSAIED
jgi:putative radical SAM enzyme (TIGR03279 family)